MTAFRELAELCVNLERVSGKNDKVVLVTRFLRRLRPGEIGVGVRFVIGRVFPVWDQRELNVGGATFLRSLELAVGSLEGLRALYRKTGDVGEAVRQFLKQRKPSQRTLLGEETKGLELLEVYRVFERIAEAVGPGSQERKRQLLAGLLRRCSPLEAKYVTKLAIGEEMRHGVGPGLMEEAIAAAFEIPDRIVRRAHMLLGDLGDVAERAHRGERLDALGIVLGRPLYPMLAEPMPSVKDAIEELGLAAYEFKLDGARVQIHCQRPHVWIFSRRLNEVTPSIPEIVQQVLEGVKGDCFVLEGELVAISPENQRPLPFQYVMRRFRRIHGIAEEAKKIPLKLYLFDVLHYEGEDLIDRPYRERRALLERIVSGIDLVPQIVSRSVDEVEAFLQRAIEAGHEGLMGKRLDAPYTPGSRGKLWVKIKPAPETLDLVIIAAEWGHGYRRNWLSDYYLAARDPNTGEFLCVGKTYTGLSDSEIREMTRRLLQLKIREEGRVVIVRPAIVVEVGFAEVQKSPHYKSGLALRFARILRIRDDKSPEEADTIERVRQIYEQQFRYKGAARPS